MTELHLESLHIYPVKSARGISADRWPLDDFGLRWDRRWMVVDPDGQFLSQRELPRLALIDVAVTDRSLVLSAAGAPALTVPLEQRVTERLTVRVWNDLVNAEPCGADADDWLGTLLGYPLRLMRMPEDAVRQVDARYVAPGHRTAFSDGFPFLLIGRASLDDLNSRLEQPLPMNRFRPNLVVGGAEPYAEDGWEQISIGSIPFHVARPCSRCVITTTDQETAARGVEPLRTLATYRRRGDRVVFGQNLVHRGPGALQVGDRVVVRSSRSEQ